MTRWYEMLCSVVYHDEMALSHDIKHASRSKTSNQQDDKKKTNSFYLFYHPHKHPLQHPQHISFSKQVIMKQWSSSDKFLFNQSRFGEMLEKRKGWTGWKLWQRRLKVMTTCWKTTIKKEGGSFVFEEYFILSSFNTQIIHISNCSFSSSVIRSFAHLISIFVPFPPLDFCTSILSTPSSNWASMPFGSAPLTSTCLMNDPNDLSNLTLCPSLSSHFFSLDFDPLISRIPSSKDNFTSSFFIPGNSASMWYLSSVSTRSTSGENEESNPPRTISPKFSNGLEKKKTRVRQWNATIQNGEEKREKGKGNCVEFRRTLRKALSMEMKREDDRMDSNLSFCLFCGVSMAFLFVHLLSRWNIFSLFLCFQPNQFRILNKNVSEEWKEGGWERVLLMNSPCSHRSFSFWHLWCSRFQYSDNHVVFCSLFLMMRCHSFKILFFFFFIFHFIFDLISPKSKYQRKIIPYFPFFLVSSKYLPFLHPSYSLFLHIFRNNIKKTKREKGEFHESHEPITEERILTNFKFKKQIRSHHSPFSIWWYFIFFFGYYLFLSFSEQKQ